MRNDFLYFAYSLMLFLLCQCSVKHQPVLFEPYFSEGYDLDLPKWINERNSLLKKSSLTLLEKKRLFDLYDAELRTVRPSTPLYDDLKNAASSLLPDIKSVQKDLDDLSSDQKIDLSGLKTPPDFDNQELKRPYYSAQQLWNRELNDAALTKVNLMLQSATFRSSSTQDKFRVYHLRFRVALDVGNETAISESYQKMKEFQPCAPETSHAALLYAFRLFASGNTSAAADLYSKQCDGDGSNASQIRRKYWIARFTSPNAGASELYRQCIEPGIPGYYSLLAQAKLENQISLPKEYLSGNLSFSEFDVSGRIHDLLVSAEERLASGLRRDATVYLLAVAKKLKGVEVNEKTITPFIYTASLFQAAGQHLEAMRLFSAAQNYLVSMSPITPAVPIAFKGDLLDRMFPRPFASRVDWLSRLWGVDPDFVYSIMRQESAFNPEAVSATNARGLMQVMPTVAKQLTGDWKNGAFFSDRALFSPDENLKVAIFYIHQLDELLPHPALVAAAYNAGFHRVIQWVKKFGWLSMDAFIETIPINETRNYVKLVMRNYIYYKALSARKPVEGKLLSEPLPYLPATASLIP
jgi:soluble lytic murein transglycosylase-like protein